ncbi:MAG: DUF4830 domain-containing protein [Oscillospiraceae bacterium]|nr:DUF4830 domain-containing protein [Oscillospiraceae bacterium]
MTEKRHHSGKALLMGVLLLLVAAVWGVIRLNTVNSGGIEGATNEQRLAYINSYGWEVGITHTDVREVRVPLEFDEVYEKYNDIQREQGFDLRKYRACTVKKYTYAIENPSSDSVPLCANLLVYEGRIIAADISSAEAEGVVTVLAK